MSHFASAVCINVTFWQFSKNPTNSDSIADAMTFIIILHYTCTGPFWGGGSVIGVLYFGMRETNPPDMLCAYGSNM